MHDATEHLRALASRIVDAARERVPLRAALLVGSAGRGDADFYSDLDLLVYVDELPTDETLDEVRAAVGGVNPIRRERTEHACGEEFELDGVRTEVPFITVSRADWQLDQLLEELNEVDSPHQKVLLGLLEGLPLYGEDLVERWRSRVRAYPEPLRRAMIDRYWDFFPVWYYRESMAVRDAELWRLDMVLEAAFNLLGVLAGLNRLYFARFQLKHTREFVAQMAFAPPDLVERLESLFRAEPEAAAAELERLIEETRALVAREFPDLELTLRFPPGARQQPWGSAPAEMVRRTRFYYRDPTAPETNKPFRLGVLALIERNGSLLLERRADAPLWSLIGGDLQDGETLTAALVREVREETGLTVSGYELFGTFSDPTRIVSYPDGNVVRSVAFVYSVSVVSISGLRASPESEELRFFPRSELLALDLPATQRPVLERLLSDAPPPHLE
jgi:8-oxo-dGTP pyrophosphatase MutT (NUDIX family)/predicted nucleotidyltransferase